MATWRVLTPLAAVVLAVGVSGCTTWTSTLGVETQWREGEPPAEFEVGRTTKTDVLDALGPPSQLISLRDQTVFYYMQEQERGRKVLLILVNWTTVNTAFDRAIFFFDQEGVLQDYSISEPTSGPED